MEISRIPCGMQYVGQLNRPVDVIICDEISGADNPFDVAFSCRFIGPDGQYIELPGFWDGAFVVRFAPTVCGTWHYQTVSDHSALDGLCGALEATDSANSTRSEGLEVWSAYPRHFCDGLMPVYIMGYEANWLLLIDQGDTSLGRVSSFLDTIQPHGFNMITTNVYAHNCPHWLDGSEAADDRYLVPALAPWEGGNESPDYKRLDLAFFAHMDRVMSLMLERGFYVHLMIQVYNKNVNWPELASSDDDRYWRYVISRYQAFSNVIWDTAKESYYQTAAHVAGRVALIRSLDGYGRLVTVHDANQPRPVPGGKERRYYSPDRELLDDLVDFKADQVHVDHYQDAVRSFRAPRPYVNIEYGYEQGVKALPTYRVKQDWREVLRRTWLVTMGGAYPNYYYSNTAWNLWDPLPEPPGYGPHGLYKAFWEGTRFWAMVPDSAPLVDARDEEVLCRCERGVEYVLMVQTDQVFAVTLDSAETFVGQWFDPYTGRTMSQSVQGGKNMLHSPWPDQDFAVLHIAAVDSDSF